MSQSITLDVFYPYPPERVWQVLTDRRALAAWMMETDFEPILGHKFQFFCPSLPGLTTTIQCEVIEMQAPTRLVYTWKESPTAEPSLVIWTLTTVSGGTQLCLKHHQYSYTTAMAPFNRLGASRLETTMSAYRLGLHRTPTRVAGFAAPLAEPAPLSCPWNYFLNQRLLNVLAPAEPTHLISAELRSLSSAET